LVIMHMVNTKRGKYYGVLIAIIHVWYVVVKYANTITRDKVFVIIVNGTAVYGYSFLHLNKTLLVLILTF
jgi:hypothetical protein